MAIRLTAATDEWVDCGSDTTLDNIFGEANGSSICYLIKPRTGISNPAYFFAKGWGNVLLYWATNGIRTIHDFSGTNGMRFISGYTVNAWHTVGFWYDGSSGGPEAFIDGVKKTVGSGINEDITPSGSISADASNTLKVGRNPGSAGGDHDIQMVAIWKNIKLTDDEHTSLANGAYPTTIRPDKLVLYQNYKTLDAPDLSGNENNGTINNSPSLIDNYYNTPDDYQQIGHPSFLDIITAGGPILRAITASWSLGGGSSTRKLTANRTNPESISFTDLITTKITKFRTDSSTISFSDSIVQLKTNFKTIANFINPFTRVTSKVSHAKRSPPSQSITLSETTSRVYHAFRTLTENLSLTDNAVASIVGTILRLINNTLSNFTGTATRKLTARRQLKEETDSFTDLSFTDLSFTKDTGGFSLSSNINAVKLFTATLTESISISDILTRILSAIRNSAGTLSFSDVVTGLKGNEALVSGSLALTGVASRILSAKRSVSGAITLSAVLTKLVTFKRLIQFLDITSITSLKVLYKFEDDLTDSKNSNDGTVSGLEQYAIISIGKAFLFDGSTRIDVNDHATLNPTSKMSFGGRFFLKPHLASAGVNRIIFKNLQYAIQYHSTSDNQIGVFVRIGATWHGAFFNYTPDTEYHIATAWTSGSLKIFVNADQKDENTSAVGSITVGTAKLGLGGNPAEGELVPNGTTSDDIRIYDVELTPAQVMAWYSHSFPISFSSIITRLTPNVFRTINASLVISSVVTRILSAIRSTSSSVSLPSVVTAKTILTESITDTLSNITGSVSRVFHAKRILNKVVNLPVIISIKLSAVRTVSGVIVITDLTTSMKAEFVNLANNIGITGTVSAKGIFKRILSGTITITGSVVSLLTIGASVGDIFGIFGTVTRKLVDRRNNTSSLSFIGFASAKKIFLRIINNLISSLTGSVSASIIQFIQLTENISLSGSVSRVFHAVRSLIENITLSGFGSGIVPSQFNEFRITGKAVAWNGITTGKSVSWNGTILDKSITLTKVSGKSVGVK